ncbi:F0F1 ATP synthase subunit A [Mobilicoccus pelagius]|uniref:ATP synthase subunit a n=1 Tax=Mobilicoccus pelagius NBRC 104925 TaxID=1089455 RepID=H5UMS6_9MICO|nr:F0F1 ATP synthase subunit A [Mobilicoccus pelagius]GAB47034.1 ATP synthase subunit a [Mobilicoccus pelagius NBRC 104925]
MSHVQVAALLPAWAAASGNGEGFIPPAPADFWHPLFGTSGEWAFTRPMLVSLCVTALVSLFLWFATRRASAVPTKSQFMLEYVYDFVRNGVGRDMIGARDFRQFVPLLFALFMFIWVNNLAGVIPPFQNPTTARIGFPIALTLVVYLTYHFVGVRKHGFGGYFKSLVPSGLPAWIVPAIFVLEFITKFITQPLTLTLRLFGNMFAGHMLLVLFILGGEFLLFSGTAFNAIAGVGSFAMAIIFTLFEVLIQSLQAYVFTLLTASYIHSAIADEH